MMVAAVLGIVPNARMANDVMLKSFQRSDKALDCVGGFELQF
jgi:hypothetical protein